MFDQSPKPVYEKQPVRQTSQRIGHLSLSDVGLGAGHPQSFSRIVEYREPSVQHPAKRAVLVEHAMLALEKTRRAVALRGHLLFDSLAICVMNSIDPLFWALADLVVAPTVLSLP